MLKTNKSQVLIYLLLLKRQCGGKFVEIALNSTLELDDFFFKKSTENAGKQILLYTQDSVSKLHMCNVFEKIFHRKILPKDYKKKQKN